MITKILTFKNSLIIPLFLGELDISQDNVQELLISADMLELEDVVAGCTDFLKQELHSSNAIGIYRYIYFH